jgi:hypothetical protein
VRVSIGHFQGQSYQHAKLVSNRVMYLESSSLFFAAALLHHLLIEVVPLLALL